MIKSCQFIAFFFIFSILPFGLVAQDNYTSNVRTEISNGQKMLIKYDLLAPDPAALFNVTVSLKEAGEEVTYGSGLMGDFGNLTTSGRDKAIVWYFKVDGFKGNIDDIRVFINAVILPSPIADFSFKIGGDKIPYKVSFSNLSSNSNTFSWNFGDPGSGPLNVSDARNPEHTYLRSRIYTVSLIASSDETGLQDSIAKQIQLNLGELPVADFTFSLTSNTAPTTAWFKNKSSKAQEYYWNFGDPDSGNDNHSAKKNPVHIFSKPGTYNVVLTVTNTKSMERHSNNKEIVVGSSK